MTKQSQSVVYNRAESMLLASKYNFQQDVFLKELKNVLAEYMDVESIVLTVQNGKDNQLVLTVSGKNFKGTILPS